MPEHGPADPADVVVVRLTVRGGWPVAVDVREQERRYAALAPCGLPAADRDVLAPARLAAFAATVWLPPSAAEDPMVPEPWQGWDWPSGATLVVDVDHDPSLPGFHGYTGALPGARGAVVGGRPMQVDRRDPDETGRDYRGWVRGFLTDRARLYAAVAAPSAAERDGLLSAVFTLTPDAGGSGSPAPTPDPAPGGA